MSADLTVVEMVKIHAHTTSLNSYNSHAPGSIDLSAPSLWGTSKPEDGFVFTRRVAMNGE